MLKLNTTPTDPAWFDLLPGVRVKVRHFTVSDHLVARGAATQVFRDNPTTEDDPSYPAISAASAVAMVATYARRGIVEWEGIGDEAGEPAAVTHETIDALMAVIPAFDAFDRTVVMPSLVGNV